jgi:hypothetical protein
MHPTKLNRQVKAMATNTANKAGGYYPCDAANSCMFPIRNSKVHNMLVFMASVGSGILLGCKQQYLSIAFSVVALPVCPAEHHQLGAKG